MNKRLSFPLASLLLAGVISVAPAFANESAPIPDFSAAFKGSVSEQPVLLNQDEMKETEGEWGWVVRVAAFLVGAGVRAPQPTHAPGVLNCHPTPSGDMMCNQ